MAKSVRVGSVVVGGRSPLVMIAGPCVIESREHCLAMARRLKSNAGRCGIPLIFKASFDKANRTSHRSYRGPGIALGLEILAEVKRRYDLPVMTDVHEPWQVNAAADAVDLLQLPAYLCRQTDLVTAMGESGRPVNIKKGQFLAPADVKHVVAKIERTGNRKILITERGTSFGYNDLVADMRSLLVLRETGYPIVFDATHSVQSPGGDGDRSGGDGHFAPYLARAAAAVGCDAVFTETHDNPDRALSDGANAIPLRAIGKLWRILKKIDRVDR